MRTLRFAFAVIVAASLVVSSVALAVGKRAAKPPPAPAAPPPQVTIALTAVAPDHGWEVRLTNAGTVPVRIVADPRLYSFEIAPPAGAAPPPPPPTTRRGHRGAPAAHGPIKCALPSDMVPTTDTERTLTLVAGRSWTVSIDPRLFCFSATQGAALVEGASVTTTFGWLPSRDAPPYAVAPITQGADAGVGPTRNIVAQPVTLPAGSAAASSGDGGAPTASADAGALADGGNAGVEPALSDAYPVHLKASLPDRLDTSRVYERTVTVSVVNEGDRTVRSLFTPTTVGFDVETPRGIVLHCGAEREVTILPELAGSLRPRGRTAISLDLGAACPDVFRKPGLYRVRPRFDARKATGSAAGHYFSGMVVGEPMLLRVRHGEDPLPPPRVDPL